MFNKSLAKRLVCNNQCPYFQKCPYSLAKNDIDYGESTSCEMVNETPDMKRAFMNLFVFGDEGLKDEVIRSTFRVKKLTDWNKVESVERYANLLLRVAKQYGVREELMPTGPVTIDIKGIEIPEPKKMQDVVLDDGRVVQEDKESLFLSPNLEKIVRKYSE